ncbi:hypothetical protein ACFQS7_19445 [Dankookia sp. GCM10030260]|uniref:hypothetical protein n=1 Tax=Dankookia sp. GCM10030260 TaxID=3273390 RepID=UPI00360B6D0E
MVLAEAPVLALIVALCATVAYMAAVGEFGLSNETAGVFITVAVLAWACLLFGKWLFGPGRTDRSP